MAVFIEVDAGSPGAQAAMTSYFAELGSTRRPPRSSGCGWIRLPSVADWRAACSPSWSRPLPPRPTVRLDTNPAYLDIGRYNDNPYAGLWFEKRLA